MTNSDMKAGRFLRWHRSRKLIASIVDHLRSGGAVTVATPLKATIYREKHASMFKACRNSAYVQRGKHWDCIDYCTIRWE